MKVSVWMPVKGSRAATIPERTDQQAGRRRRGHRGGRPSAFDPNTYRRRNVFERPTNRLKQWRGIATRYDKLAVPPLRPAS
jgi:transposase